MTSYNVSQMWIKQNDLADISLHTSTLTSGELTAGQVLLATETFGFSANNITYAAFGSRMGYWGFFPAPEGFGIVPVWGFAKVVESNCEGIEVGEKFFGYLPMASHIVVQPAKVTPYGFHDAHPQRKSISPVYDNYLRCSADPGYNPEREAWQLNFRPLFKTSFVLDDFVGEETSHDYIIVTSASSKTALGTAHLLMKNRAARKQHYQVIGLTSAGNKAFTEQSQCYDKVVGYSDIGKLNLDGKSWVLDFAANGTVMGQLSALLGSNLDRIALIGATDWDANEKPSQSMPGAAIFFAPTQVKKLVEEWGQQEFLTRYSEAWASFAHKIDGHMHECDVNGVEQMVAIYHETLNGKADTKALNVVRF